MFSGKQSGLSLSIYQRDGFGKNPVVASPITAGPSFRDMCVVNKLPSIHSGSSPSLVLEKGHPDPPF